MPRNGREWQGWSCSLGFAAGGPTTLMCRATDAAGRTQPFEGLRNEVHHVPVNISPKG